MFDTELIEQLARELNQSKNSRVQIEQFTKRFHDMTIKDGYKISRAWLVHLPVPLLHRFAISSKPIMAN